MIPGEYFLSDEPIEINAGRPTRASRSPIAAIGRSRSARTATSSRSTAPCRSIAPAAYGMRLNIAAGTAVRFEPGDTREVELVALGGTREVYGLNGLVNGALDDEAVAPRLTRAFERRCGRDHSPETRSPRAPIAT